MRRILTWLALAVTSIAFATLMRELHVPAAFMLGPMIAAIFFALSGAGIRLHKNYSLGAQAIMGCLIAHLINPGLLAVFTEHWLMLVAINIAALLLIVALGLLITRRGWLPDTTAIWGLSPGAASAMVLLADDYGADPRIVAMMQYSRIVFVSIAAIALAASLGPLHAGIHASIPGLLTDRWFAPVHLIGTIEVAALTLSGYAACKLTGKANLALFLPAFGGALLQGLGLIAIDVPPLASALAFALTGWYVGLTFTRQSALYCLRLFPRMMLAIAAMILICGLLSLVLARAVPGTDMLTAYLALSPGGIDTAVMIATGSKVFLPLVLASQFVRLVIVLSTGPSLAKVAAARLRPRNPPGTP
jgi:membrane AbrB-like protein